MKKVLIADKMSVQAEKVFMANGISFEKKQDYPKKRYVAQLVNMREQQLDQLQKLLIK